LAKVHSPGTVFLAASLDKPADLEKVQDRIKYSRLTNVEHAFSGNEGDDEAALAFRVERLPAMFVVDKNGIIRGASGDLDDIEQLLQRK
jgi:hypothetical protein